MNEEIEKARKVLEEISQDEEERKLAEQREIWQIDYNSMRYSMEKKVREAESKVQEAESKVQEVESKARENGKKEGKYENCKVIAKKMIDEGFDIEAIKRITELSESEIESLKD